VLSLLSEMFEATVTPDVISYNSAISALGKGGRWELALDVLGQMPQIGVIPDAISYSAVISACEDDGQWQLALNLLYRAKPDTTSFNAAISACAKGGQWELALVLLSKMRTMKAVPTCISFSAAISVHRLQLGGCTSAFVYMVPFSRCVKLSRTDGSRLQPSQPYDISGLCSYMWSFCSCCLVSAESFISALSGMRKERAVAVGIELVTADARDALLQIAHDHRGGYLHHSC
jgi:pentatricopeptide repeat protein